MKMEWIPTSEKIPTESGEYLACTEEGDVFVAHFAPGRIGKPIWWNLLCVGYRAERVIAWMPMPTPYGKETDDGYYPIYG